jgi:hypothetical protein
MSHIGSSSGPRFDRGRKHFVHNHWTRTEVALVLCFLLMVVLIVMLGMYLGWWSMREEEKSSSPQGLASVFRRPAQYDHVARLEQTHPVP